MKNLLWRRRVVAGLSMVALVGVVAAGGARPTAAHAAVGHRALVGRGIVAAQRANGTYCYTVRPELGGYVQRNIHNYGGGYAGWVQVSLIFCTGSYVNYAHVIVHPRSGLVSGSAVIYRDPSNQQGALPPDSATGSGTVGDGGIVDSPMLRSPFNPAHACWFDAGDPQGICTTSL